MCREHACGTAWRSAELPAVDSLCKIPLTFKKKTTAAHAACNSYNCTAIHGDWTPLDEAQARVHWYDLCICIWGVHLMRTKKIRGPGRELNPGPPPDDSSPKKESYY